MNGIVVTDALAITSRLGSELEETAETIKKSRMATRVLTKVANVTDKNQVENMVKLIVKTFGGIDILINNVGGAQRAKGSSETGPGPRSLQNIGKSGIIYIFYCKMIVNTI